MEAATTSLPTETRISDAHLAAYLLARDFQIVRVEDGGRGRRDFIFGGVPPEVVASFFGGDDKVSARVLLDALRNVRGLLAQRL